MTPLFVANWKMNMLRGEAEAFCARLAQLLNTEQLKAPSSSRGNNPAEQVSGAQAFGDIWLAPPYSAIETTRLALARSGLGSIIVGAQNCHWLEKGAHTGELSPPMLAELGCEFVILGHSERRQFYGETDAAVAKRARAALAHGFRAIVCVGETESEYRNGQTVARVESQLNGSLAELAREEFLQDESSSRLVIAYEPVWAIGTGLAATPEIARGVHQAIRAWLAKRFGNSTGEAVPILYGGSTTPDNISELCAQDNINGALVGGASLKAESFLQLRDRGRGALAA